MRDCHPSTRKTTLLAYPRLRLSISILGTLVVVVVAVLVSGFKSNAEAKVPAQEIELPSVQGWQIEAIRRGNSVTCSARQKEENGKSMLLLADTRKYRDGVWFLDVTSRNHHLKPGAAGTEARLFLNGKPVITGKVWAIGDSIGGKPTATYVRFEFPAIDAYVKDIKTARVVEAHAEGLSPLRLEGLSPIITVIEKCQQDGLNPEFWKEAKDVCN